MARRGCLNHTLDHINHQGKKCHFSLCQQGPHPLEQIIRHINGYSHVTMHKAWNAGARRNICRLPSRKRVVRF